MIQRYKVKQHEVKAVQWTGRNLRDIQKFCPVAVKHGKILYLRLPHMEELCLIDGWIVKVGQNFEVLEPSEFEEKYEKT